MQAPQTLTRILRPPTFTAVCTRWWPTVGRSTHQPPKMEEIAGEEGSQRRCGLLLPCVVCYFVPWVHECNKKVLPLNLNGEASPCSFCVLLKAEYGGYANGLTASSHSTLRNPLIFFTSIKCTCGTPVFSKNKNNKFTCLKIYEKYMF
jgi:hypothetical protein